MHTRLLHGSTANRSDRPRTLYISVYSAEDAIPCCPNPVPSKNEGLIVRGSATGLVRSVAYELRLPRKPTRHGLRRLLLVVGQRGSGLRLGRGKELPTQEVDGVWRGLLERGEAGRVQSGP